ncbi:MAG TPA: hypothetical protein VF069_03470, partial [Streptosporangiaceae bacterium]
MATSNADKPASAQVLDNLKWAEPAEDVEPKVALSEILVGLQLLATDEARDKAAAGTVKWDDETPGSMQVIKSGALSITKRWTKLSSRVGGVTGVLSLGAGGVAGFNDV